jgi:hypothetical protein
MHQRHQESDGRSTRQVAIACDVNAVPAERRDRWVEIGRQVFAAVEEVRELPDGYRFRVPTSSAMLLQVAEYVSNERLCCGFLRFQVEVEPAQGPVWLQLTGAEGAKGYMRTVFAASRLLDEDVARTAGFP